MVPTDSLVPSCWLGHADRRPDDLAIVHRTYGHDSVRWTWGSLLARAAVYQKSLLSRGVQPGQVCALIVRHHAEFYPLYLAVSLAGCIPSVLAYPSIRLHPDKFRQGLEGMARVSGLDWVLTESDLVSLIEPLTAIPGSTIKGIFCPLEDVPTGSGTRVASVPGDPDAPCLLQHSSGTTGLQKAVMLSHRAVLEHVRRYSSALAISAKDRIVSWLPLYHDMGFIACFHQALILGIPLVQLDPMEWVRAPYLLLEAISQEKGTLTWLPNFSYNLMADRIPDEDLDGIRLDSLRLVINCSEPIRADSHQRFLRRFAPLGLRAEALAGCYAMAETTFAVTQTRPGRIPRVLLADRAALASGKFVPARTVSPAETRACVSSGPPIEGCAVRVVGPEGENVRSGTVGDLLIQSVSLFSGYRNQPDKSAAAFRDGWYDSGDQGFLLDGEVFVIGRKKDLIIVAGKNLSPEDIEDAASGVPGILPGRVVAFGVEREETGTEEVHVVAETEVEDEVERRALCQAVQRAGIDVDVTISRVFLVPPRWLVKSSSGKVSRSANKQRAIELSREASRAA